MNLYEIRDGQLQLRMERNRLQAEAWRSDRRFTFMIAGTQAGKTTFGPWWLWREWQKRGPGDYLAVTATYDLFKLKMLPEMLRVFCELLGWGTYHATDRVILGKDGSRIILRSANSPGGLESATAKAAWLDECGQDDFTLLAWEAVLRRLALAEGRVLGTTTPYNMGWLKTEVMDRWLAGDPDYLVVQGASTENPAFPTAEYERAKRTMPGWKFAMFYQGLFERPAGMIYADFTDDNLVDPFPLPVEWPRYVGIDFGAVNTAVLWIAEDVDRAAYYVYREYMAEYGPDIPKVFYSDQAAKVARLSSWEEDGEDGRHVTVYEPIGHVVAGMDAFAKSRETGKTYVDYYYEGGIPRSWGFVPPSTDRKLRLGTWHEYLKPFQHPEDPERMTARLQIFETCIGLISTLPKLLLDEKNPEMVDDDPKVDNAYDAIGYALIDWHVSKSKPPKEDKPFILDHKDRLAKISTSRTRKRLL